MRALLALCAGLLCVAALGNTASADEGGTLPRAVPAARALPRSFASYGDLVTYATGIAADQSALDQRVIDARAELDALQSALGAITSSARRGGALFDLESETDTRETRSSAEKVSARAAVLSRTLGDLAARGALTADRTPWQMPTEGEITQPFGPTSLWVEPAREYGGVSYAHFHDGVDISGPWAAPVFAPARGRVVFVGQMMDGAEVIVIAHDAGLVSLYAHLDNFANPPTVAAGDEVAGGQRIGTVGLTGITTGEHLHWAVYRDGELVDPLSLIAE